MITESLALSRAMRNHAKRFGAGKLKASLNNRETRHLPKNERPYPKDFIRVVNPEAGVTSDWEFHRGRVRIIAYQSRTRMTTLQVKQAIFLEGAGGRYTVRTGRLDGMPDFPVTSVAIGNAFVAALRDMANKRGGI